MDAQIRFWQTSSRQHTELYDKLTERILELSVDDRYGAPEKVYRIAQAVTDSVDRRVLIFKDLADDASLLDDAVSMFTLFSKLAVKLRLMSERKQNAKKD